MRTDAVWNLPRVYSGYVQMQVTFLGRGEAVSTNTLINRNNNVYQE